MSGVKHTPGPWAWMGGPHGLYLATTHSGRRFVMGFRRMGFNDAQPVFRQNDRLVPAADLVEFEVGDKNVRGFASAKANDSVYRYDVSGIDNADARLIAAAPDLLEAGEGLLAAYRAAIQLTENTALDGVLKHPASWASIMEAAIARARGEQDGGGE
ncbi:hypothetical protein [Brevundimonas naejangsanensis]|uniref:hypothetical protein n=1 Tax=Brevundimonas naejangsanensis TaxID=588932 RepID=UPI0032093BFA